MNIRARLKTLGILPIPLGADGTAIAALEQDYAAWTENAAYFIAQLKASDFGGKTPSGYVVALGGATSPMVQRKLKDPGIMLATRLGAGPLQ